MFQYWFYVCIQKLFHFAYLFFKVSGEYKTPPPPAAATNVEQAWKIPPIECNEPDDGILYAQMGPTGGKHGYSAITSKINKDFSYHIIYSTPLDANFLRCLLIVSSKL